MGVKPLQINEDYLKDYCKQKGLKLVNVSTSMGMDKSFLSNRVHVGTMLPAHIKHLCLLTGMNEGELIAEETRENAQATDKQIDAMTQNTELVISYIQDLGKIHSELLREVRELKELEQSVLSGVQALVGVVKYGKK